jgi:hypothetical protein
MVRMSERRRQMNSDVRKFGETCSKSLEDRLERLWRQKQREKEDRMRIIKFQRYKTYFLRR